MYTIGYKKRISQAPNGWARYNLKILTENCIFSINFRAPVTIDKAQQFI